jgi:regulator of replication initiation timing
MDEELLRKLEKRVEELLNAHTMLKQENQRLIGENSRLIGERSSIRDRIDAILEKLEGIENR